MTQRRDRDGLKRELEANATTELELVQRASELERRLQQCRADKVRLREELGQAQSEATAAFRSGGGSLLLGDGITDDTLLHVARFLPTAKDLLRLGLTSTRFTTKCIAAPSVSSGGRGGPAAAPEMLSIPEEAARRWVAGCSEQECGWVPRRDCESWLCLVHEVEVLRLPLAFARAHGSLSLTLSENGGLATKSVDDFDDRAVASKVVMRSGRHFAQFTMVYGACGLGVVRPGWDVEGGADAAEDVDGHCFYMYSEVDGRRSPGYSAWEGRQTAKQGDRIGMLLDLDQGSMTVWKNGALMGVMVAEGLSGPLCWAASLLLRGASARIASGPVPASPTGEGSWRRRRRRRRYN